MSADQITPETIALAALDGPESLPSTWEPVDLSEYVSGDYRPITPTLLTRTDGVSLMYRGMTHSFHGESESGKSLVLQYLAAQIVNDGGTVLYLDFESDPASITERLLMLGAQAEAITAKFIYRSPDVAPSMSESDRAAWTELLATRCELAVIDGVTDSITTFGYSSTDNDDVASWMREFPKRLASETGAAVAVIDHVAKSADSRGRFAIGGQQKMAGLTGAGYTVEVDKPLGRGLRGVIVLRVGKDRPGYIRGQSATMRTSDRTQETARVVVDSTGPHTVVTIEPPRDRSAEPQAFRPTALMHKVSESLALADKPLSYRKIYGDVHGKQEYVREAIKVLVAEGYVSTQRGARNSTLHTLVKPYDQYADPLADSYQSTGDSQRLQIDCDRLPSIDGRSGDGHSTVSGRQSGDSRETVGTEPPDALPYNESGGEL